MTNPNPVELKPCCGLPPILQSNGIGDYYYVCSGCDKASNANNCETVEKAKLRWNTRANELPSKPEQLLKVKSPMETLKWSFENRELTAREKEIFDAVLKFEEGVEREKLRIAKAALTRAIEKLRKLIESCHSRSDEQCDACVIRKNDMHDLIDLRDNLRVEDL